MDVCLGLDTSCYTTSVALCGVANGAAEGSFFQQRQLLTVPEGARGLMQSEMVFQHVTRLPVLWAALRAERAEDTIVAVCASVRPRPDEGSYMPAFRVGEGMGRSIALAMGIPFYATTHQEGHLRAARMGTDLFADTPHVALHLSGGTTEILLADRESVTLLGGSADLHAGQLIDRIGVALGLLFPAGPALEKLAYQGTSEGRLSSSVRGLDCHFSGAETQAQQWIAEGALPPETIAAEVFDCVARTVARLVVSGCEQTGGCDVLLGGGVATSQWLRDAVVQRVARRNRTIRLHWAQPSLSGDNAVGVAKIGIERYQNQQ